MALLSSVPFGRSVGRSEWEEMQHSMANPGLFRGTKHQRSPLLGMRVVVFHPAQVYRLQSFTKALARHTSWRHLLDFGLA